ncbi:MAG: DUF1003 domain-containing protein [Alphaproteobacteria bacterium]|nr:DUF1003 domain-containing protein [Alphaproteobacteria bacterium]
MAANVELLADVPLFEFLDEKERADLATRIEEVTFPPDHLIFAAGDPGDAMFVIRTGEVEIFFKDNTGHKIVLETATVGDFFGDISLLDRGARTASARTVAQVEALRIDPHDLDGLVRTYPQAAFHLLSAMGRRARVTAELLRHTASRNVNEAIEDTRSAVDRAADWIAAFTGSIPFLLIHVVVFAVWIGWNTMFAEAAQFDPFPFGLLTMAVSLEAIILSVFVLLSQNRQIEKDRVRSDVEYDVNLKAELEVMQLHEKVDRLTSDVLVRLATIERGLKK